MLEPRIPLLYIHMYVLLENVLIVASSDSRAMQTAIDTRADSGVARETVTNVLTRRPRNTKETLNTFAT